MGAFPVGPAGRRPERGEPLLTPAIAVRSPERRLRRLRPQVFELVCADAHPLGCVEVIRSQDRDTLVVLAREHGERAHGFTAAWYSAERLAAIANAVTPR
jgi:hypothetical protein